MTNGTENWPSSAKGAYARWDLSAWGWSRAEFGEETIKIQVEDGRWYACTEADQCVRRDLDDADIASIRTEFNLRGIPGA